MKTNFKSKEDKLFYQSRYFSVYDSNGKVSGNQQFVVPWQMQKTEDIKRTVNQF